MISSTATTNQEYYRFRVHMIYYDAEKSVLFNLSTNSVYLLKHLTCNRVPVPKIHKVHFVEKKLRSLDRMGNRKRFG